MQIEKFDKATLCFGNTLVSTVLEVSMSVIPAIIKASFRESSGMVGPVDDPLTGSPKISQGVAEGSGSSTGPTMEQCQIKLTIVSIQSKLVLRN